MGSETSRWGSSAARYTGYNVAAPGPNTAICGGIKFGPNASACRVTVVTCTDGTTPHKWGLNGVTALTAGDLFTFVFAVRSTDDGLDTGTDLTYDFEVETDGVIEILLVDEVTGGVV